MGALRFLLGLVLGFVAGWLVLRKAREPDPTQAELIEVELLNDG